MTDVAIRRLDVADMTLVAKEHGGRGHGRALMGHAMDAAGSVPIMLFATSAGRPLYENLGFVTLDQNTSYKGRVASREPVVSDAATAADLADIIELDRAVAGCDRQRMLTAYFSFADEIRVLRVGSAIVGYAGTWTHQDYSVIGPVVAPNDAAARTLVHDVASTIDRPVRIQIAESRVAFGEWATEHGFAPMATTSFMVHDGRPIPGDRERLYMPITLALG